MAEDATEFERQSLADLGYHAIEVADAARRAVESIRAGGGPNAHVPVIAVTADTAPEDIAACTAAGMTYFVPKPITPPMLLGAITHVMTMAEDQSGVEEMETAVA